MNESKSSHLISFMSIYKFHLYLFHFFSLPISASWLYLKV